MEVITDNDYQIVARKMMEILLYDNGGININEPDNLKRYPIFIFDDITVACKIFFGTHPELLTDENLEEICTGEFSKIQNKYSQYSGFKKLDTSLGEFFNIL